MLLDDLVLELLRIGRHRDTSPWPEDHCDGVRETGEDHVAPGRGASRSLGGAAAVPHRHGEQLGLGEEPAGAADVEDLRTAAEDDRDDPAGAGEAAGLAWADAFAGVEDPGLLQPPGEGVEVDGHHDGGIECRRPSGALGRDAFDELGERPAHPLRTRPPLHTRAVGGGLVLGGGDREEHLLQHRRLHRRQGEPAVDSPVPVVGHRQPGRLRRLGLFLLQQVGLVRVGEVGCDHLQQPAPEDPQGPWRRARRPRRPGVARP